MVRPSPSDEEKASVKNENYSYYYVSPTRLNQKNDMPLKITVVRVKGDGWILF